MIMEQDSPKEKQTVAAKFRRYFATGLLVLAPVWLTVYIILLVVELLGGFLSPYFRILGRAVIGTGKWMGVVTALSDITAFIVTVLGITLIGMLVRRVAGQRLLKSLDYIVGKIPVVREVYVSIRKFIDIFWGEKSNFQRVVAVNFPTPNSWIIGFVTGENLIKPNLESEGVMLSVFVPTAPNPTSGYLLLAEEKNVRPLALTVDEAMKLIVTGGTMVPERYSVNLNTAEQNAD
jgi:uncharacterized membrane protein